MSDIITAVGNFLLSTWIWGMTWGVGHLPLSCIVMMLLLCFVVRTRWRAVFLLPLLSHLFAGLSFTLFVVGVVIHLLGFNYQWDGLSNADVQALAMQSSIDLGLMYATLETIFFVITRRWFHASMQWLFLTVFISNAIAAWLVYRFLPAL